MKVRVLVLCAIVSGSIIAPGSAQAQTQPTPSPPIEGRVTIARATNGRTPSSSADALFARSPLWGTEIASDGPCRLYVHPVIEGLSAGTIKITGTVQPITLVESRSAGGVKYKHSAPVPNPSFADGVPITVEVSGGADVPAFTASVNAPPTLAGYTPPTSLSRTGFTVTWTANAGTEIMIMVGALNRRRLTEGVLVMCRVPDTGAFTVPASTFALIPPAFDLAVVMVARVAETVQMVSDARIAIEAISSVGSGPFALDPSARNADAITRATVPPTASTVRHETSPGVFLSAAFGLGGVSRNGDVPPTGIWTGRLQLGQRLRHGLHLVEEVNSLGNGDISPYPPARTEAHLSMGAGVRWTPFEPRPQRSLNRFIFPSPYVDIRAFYLTAVIGADVRDRFPTSSTTDETAWSPMTSLAVGLLEIQGHDWSLGPEFREQLAYYDGHLQRGWMALLAIHLDEW